MVEDMEAVRILLVEYETLREESFLRIKSRFAIVGYGGAVIAFFATQSDVTPWFRSAIAVVAAISLAVIWFRFGQLIVKCQRRLAEIEAQVNSKAGDNLLVWNSCVVPTVLFHRIHKSGTSLAAIRAFGGLKGCLRRTVSAMRFSPPTKTPTGHEEDHH